MPERSGHAVSGGPGGPTRTSEDMAGAPPPSPKIAQKNCPHDLAAVRAVLERFRQYLLSHFWHYHRLWKLNYRVRDGNGCDLPDMFTGNTVTPPKRRKVVPPLSRRKVVVIGMPRASSSQALDTSGQAFVR